MYVSVSPIVKLHWSGKQELEMEMVPTMAILGCQLDCRELKSKCGRHTSDFCLTLSRKTHF